MHRLPPRFARVLLTAPPSLLAAAAAMALSILPAAAQEPGVDPGSSVQAIATRGTWAALAASDGRIIVLDVAEGRRFEWQAPRAEIMALGIAIEEAGRTPGAAAPVLLVATPGERRRTSDLHALAGETGEEIARGTIPGRAVILLGGPGGRPAYVLTTAGRRADPEGEADPAEWSLVVADLTRDETTSYGAGRGVQAAAISPGGDRIYVALQDEIRTYSTGPLRSSWMMRSPGRNRAVLPFLDGRFIVLRDRQIARFDPSSPPGRDPETGLFPDDDAVTALDLPFEVHSLALSFDGREVAVFDEEGRRMVLADLDEERIREARDLPGAAAAIFHPVQPSLYLFSPNGDLSEMRFGTHVARPPDSGREGAPAASVEPAGPEPGARSGADVEPGSPGEAPQPVASPEPEEVVKPLEAPPPEAAPGQTSGPEEEATSPVVEDAGPLAVPTPEGPSEPQIPRPAGAEPPSAEGPDGSPPPHALSGKLTGDLSLVEAVVMYGPDSIFKEHARVRPSADGTFSLPLPPEGMYRFLLAGIGGAQLRCTPPFRQVLVASEPIGGLDFDVTGIYEGALKP